MKTRILMWLGIVILAVLANGCVSQADFDKFVGQVNYQLDILACEARVDAYENRTGSDEPDPTRRDEPLSTRRDEPGGTRRDLMSCEAEFGRVVGGTDPVDNYSKCQPKLVTCANDPAIEFPICNECFDTCMSDATGTWPDAMCDVTP